MRLFLLFVIVFAALPVFAQPAPLDGAAILARVDSVATQAADFTARVELETVDAKGATTARTFTVWQKGQDRRLVKLSAPARLRGVGLLATGPDELHTYLPSFGRVRRVAGRKRGEPFLSSNFSQDDMVRTGYAARFKATLLEDGAQSWTLRLDPKKPKDEPHHHLILTVRKSDAIPGRIDCYDAEAGAPVRRIEATDIRPVKAVPIAHRIVATDLRDQSTSTATLHDVAVDSGLEDELFTQRFLKRTP